MPSKPGRCSNDAHLGGSHLYQSSDKITWSIRVLQRGLDLSAASETEVLLDALA